jgi:hypothetical protein
MSIGRLNRPEMNNNLHSNLLGADAADFRRIIHGDGVRPNTGLIRLMERV